MLNALDRSYHQPQYLSVFYVKRDTGKELVAETTEECLRNFDTGEVTLIMTDPSLSVDSMSVCGSTVEGPFGKSEER